MEKELKIIADRCFICQKQLYKKAYITDRKEENKSFIFVEKEENKSKDLVKSKNKIPFTVENNTNQDVVSFKLAKIDGNLPTV